MRIVGGVMAPGSTKNVDMVQESRSLATTDLLGQKQGADAWRYSKKVFILSKKPSLSSSIDMPLSLANSSSNSFWRAVSLVGI